MPADPRERPENKVQRVPRRLGFSFPPTKEEMDALVAVRKARSVGAVFAAGIETGGRIIVQVEWIGTEAAPDVLSARAQRARE